MMALKYATTILILSLCGVAISAPLLGAPASGLEGSYIVVFQNDLAENEAIKLSAQIPAEDVTHSYNFGTFRGMAAELNDSAVKVLLEDERVQYVEYQQMMSISQACKVQQSATWGLNRISQRSVNLNGRYNYADGAGSSVTSYVIDTGIYLENEDFEGRAEWGINTSGDKEDRDCNGHGTHVASTMGGVTYGVAKKTTLVAVKVLACDGRGSNAGVIAGIQFASTNRKGRPAVANMSLGGSKSSALNDAVASAVKSGLTMVVAAGNEDQDACLTSPASEMTAITVGATDVEDNRGTEIDARSYFSNWGKCVDIMAPGSLITAAWIGGVSATNTISGTSMASPHVAGAVALYLDANNQATPGNVKTAIIKSATPSKVSMDCKSATSTCSSTPNVLLFTEGCGQ